MEIYGKYIKTISRDEYSGNTVFSFLPDDGAISHSVYGDITVHGRIQGCIKGMPLKLSCEPTDTDNNYTLDDYELTSNSPKTLKEFLTSFRGIGDVKAEKIINQYNDIFRFCQQPDAVKILVRLGLSEANSTQFVTRIRSYYQHENVFKTVLKYGGSYTSVVSLVKLYKDNTEHLIKRNPYIMANAGISFAVCEQVANSLGLGQYVPERVSALINEAYQKYIQNGHTKITFFNLCKRCNAIEKDAGMFYQTKPFYIAGALDDNFIIKQEDDDCYIYRKEQYNLELNSALNIKRISVYSNHLNINDSIISTIEFENDILYSEKQKEAFKLLETPGVKILTGGPGTGKTTVINGLISAYKQCCPTRNIILCAPTGCAAKRLSQATNEHASTIHKLLGVKPSTHGLMQNKNENNRINAGLIIVDESSMLDSQLFNMLLKAVGKDTVLLLSGDEDQLPPVGQGNILHDLLNVSFVPKCRLKEVFRQKGDSSIIENSIQIRDGKEELKEDSHFQIIHCNTEEEMMCALKDAMNQYYSKENPDKTKVYVPVKNRKYAISTFAINTEMHKVLNATDARDVLTYHDKVFSVGDPVIFLSNNYQIGYYNGDTGIITAVLSYETSKSLLILSDGHEYELSGADLKDVELAYAITIHKSQGSECENAIIMLSETPDQMLSRNLLYVAATRAKEKNILIVQGQASHLAIKNRIRSIRYTGLKNRLAEIA